MIVPLFCFWLARSSCSFRCCSWIQIAILWPCNASCRGKALASIIMAASNLSFTMSHMVDSPWNWVPLQPNHTVTCLLGWSSVSHVSHVLNTKHWFGCILRHAARPYAVHSLLSKGEWSCMQHRVDLRQLAVMAGTITGHDCFQARMHMQTACNPAENTLWSVGEMTNRHISHEEALQAYISSTSICSAFPQASWRNIWVCNVFGLPQQICKHTNLSIQFMANFDNQA